ncbi:hypothetical protein E1B28_003090 [Marasmius oreades]|nr:uncharacterized protein E1B28_003090 [Marasmius oreades]KAG7085532.1 hypothetical protein E1B28_003090 [Marasmius oreades]
MIHLGINQKFLPHLENASKIPVFLPSVIESFYAQYKRVMHDARSLEDWFSTKKQEYISMIEHNQLCEEWRLHKIEDRKTELEDLRCERAYAIITRLYEDGWESQDLDTLEKLHYRTIYQPVAFDENTWPDVRPHFTQSLVQIKADRLKREEKEVYANHHQLFQCAFDSFCKKDSRSAVTVPIGDVVFTSAKLNGLLWRLPCEEDDLYTEFMELLNHEFAEIAQGWTGRVEQELISILRNEIPNADIETLKSVGSVFECRYCSEPLWYPFLLGHSCFRRGGEQCQHLEQSASGHIKRSNWRNIFDPFREKGFSWDLWYMDSTRVAYSNSAKVSKFMMAILSVCGFNPESTSMKELLKADPFLVCSDCCSRSYGGNKKIVGWTKVLQEYHRDHNPSHLSIGDQSDLEMQAIVLKEYEGEEVRLIRGRTCWNGVRLGYLPFFCKLCRGSSGRFDFNSYRTLKAHMSSRHEITDESIIDETWEVNPTTSFNLDFHPYPIALPPHFESRRVVS